MAVLKDSVEPEKFSRTTYKKEAGSRRKKEIKGGAGIPY
jgi:hypothetical protein